MTIGRKEGQGLCPWPPSGESVLRTSGESVLRTSGESVLRTTRESVLRMTGPKGPGPRLRLAIPDRARSRGQSLLAL
jgi:hypothetical protein